MVGTALTASVSDPDTVSGTMWQWSRSVSPDAGFDDITNATGASYTPVAADKAFFLRATASYTDNHGATSAAGITAVPVGVTAATLAQNTGQTASDDEPIDVRDGGRMFQGFDTGDNPAGYVLSGIGVAMISGSPTQLNGMEIWSRGHCAECPGSRLYTLQAPPSITPGATNTFTAPPRAVLAPNTSYFLVFVDPRGVGTTRSRSLDSGVSHGWYFPNIRLFIPIRNGLIYYLGPYGRVDIRGFALLGPPGPPTGLSGSASTTSVALSWREPGSLGQSAVTKYQVRHKQTGQADTQYGNWADVADGDGDSDLADERAVTVSGLTAGTRYTFQVRAVNARGDGTEAETTARNNSQPAFSSTDYPSDAVARTVIENSSSGDLGGPITATDADSDPLSYSVAAASSVGAAAHLAAFNRDFRLNASTGQISVKGSARIDHETRSSYVVLYRVSDRKDSSGNTDGTIDDTLTLTVSVTETDDAGEVSFSRAPTVGAAMTASVSDQDTVSGTPTWQWSRLASPGAVFDDIASAAGASYTPVAADRAFFLGVTATYTDRHGSQTATRTTAVPVGVTGSTLVKNTSKSSRFSTACFTCSMNQGFTTGDNPAGYALSGVGVFSGNSTQSPAAAEIWSKQAGEDLPDSRLYSLQVPGSLRTQSLNTFRAREHAVLAPTTTYYIRLLRPGFNNLAPSGSDDSGRAHGWSIANTRLRFEGTPPDITDIGRGKPLRVAVTGFELLGPPGPPRDLSASADASSVDLSWSEPGSLGQRPVIKYQVRHKQTDENDTEYISWADVADGDGDNDLADERSVTVSGLASETSFTLQVRAVNARGDGTEAEADTTTLMAVPQEEIIEEHIIEEQIIEEQIIEEQIIEEQQTFQTPETPQDRSGGGGLQQTPQDRSGGGGLQQSGGAQTAAQRFTDVDGGAYYAAAVEWMVANEITTGCAPERFCPHQTATRAQFVTFLWRAAGQPESSVSGAERFTDVDALAYYQQAAGWAAEAGVTRGCGDGTIFCPHRPVTRGQVAAFLYRHSGRDLTASGATFEDVTPDDYYYQAVQWMAAKGITGGCAPGLFCPHTPASRTHVAVFLHRYLTQQS